MMFPWSTRCIPASFHLYSLQPPYKTGRAWVINLIYGNMEMSSDVPKVSQHVTLLRPQGIIDCFDGKRNHYVTNVIEREGNEPKFRHFLKVPQQVSTAGARAEFPGAWSSRLALHRSMSTITRTSKRGKNTRRPVCGHIKHAGSDKGISAFTFLLCLMPPPLP